MCLEPIKEKWHALVEGYKSRLYGSNQSTILAMMDFLFESNSTVYKKDFIKKFGKKNFNKFSKFCLGGQGAYAVEKGGDPNTHIELTRAGAGAFLDMQSSHRQKQIGILGIEVTLGGALLLLAGFMWENFNPTKGQSSFFGTEAIFLGFIYGIITIAVILILVALRELWDLVRD